MNAVDDAEYGQSQQTQRYRWPKIIFCIVTGVSLFLQFALEAFSRAMGLSCNVLAVMQNTPGFALTSSVILLFSTIYWGPNIALRAIGYACALHVINAGLINIVVHGAWGCYLGEAPRWVDVHPTPTGWMLVASGLLCVAAVRFIPGMARCLLIK